MIETGLFLQTGFFVIVTLAFLFSRSASFFHPLTIYLIFHFLVFVLRPLMVHALDFGGMWYYMEFRPDELQFVNTLLVSSVGLLVFALASWFAGRTPIEFTATELPPWSLAEKRSFLVVIALLSPLAIYSAIFAKAGTSFSGEGNIQMTLDLTTGISVFTNTTGYIADAHAMMGTLFILLIWRFNFRLWAYAPFIAFLAYRAFLGWGRWAIIMSIITLLLVYLYRHNRRWLKIRYLAIVLPIFVLFHSLGMNRDLIRDYVEDKGIAVADVPQYKSKDSFIDQLDNPDFANFEFLAFIVSVVPEKSQTFTYFTQYLQLFTEPIPRIIWPEKPIGAPIKLINLNDFGNFFFMTTSLAGDGWMSWGWLGVVLTLGAVGFVLGRLHRWYWRNQANPKIVMGYFVFLPLSIYWFRDGGISIAKISLWTILPIVLWSFFSRLIGDLQEKRHALQRSGPYGHRRPFDGRGSGR